MVSKHQVVASPRHLRITGQNVSMRSEATNLDTSGVLLSCPAMQPSSLPKLAKVMLEVRTIQHTLRSELLRIIP